MAQYEVAWQVFGIAYVEADSEEDAREVFLEDNDFTDYDGLDTEISKMGGE